MDENYTIIDQKELDDESQLLLVEQNEPKACDKDGTRYPLRIILKTRDNTKEVTFANDMGNKIAPRLCHYWFHSIKTRDEFDRITEPYRDALMELFNYGTPSSLHETTKT